MFIQGKYTTNWISLYIVLFLLLVSILLSTETLIIMMISLLIKGA